MDFCSQFLYFFCQICRANSQIIGLPGRINICQNHLVCLCQGLCKIVHQRFCAGIGMRLEHTPQSFMRIIFCRWQRSMDFLWMMGIIVDNGNSANLSFFLKSAVRAGKSGQSFLNILNGNSQLCSGCNGWQRIVYIMFPSYSKLNPAQHLSFFD